MQLQRVVLPPKALGNLLYLGRYVRGGGESYAAQSHRRFPTERAVPRHAGDLPITAAARHGRSQGASSTWVLPGYYEHTITQAFYAAVKYLSAPEPPGHLN